MGVCNLFKKFDSTNNNGQGILFTFSQYAEDLTAQDTLQRDHRVVPSKFVCLDLDINGFATEQSISTTNDINTAIPQCLQSYYENKISYLRGLEVEGEYTWDALDSSKFLFDFLKKYKLISEANIDQDDPTSNKYIPEVKYIGDINIYSNENEQNINYNEIYCMVPSDAMEYTYYLTAPGTREYSYSFDETPTELNGWTANYPSGTGLQNDPEFDSDNVYNTSYDAWMQALEPDAQDTEDPTDADSFTFNCIIILYDVISGNDENSNPIYMNKNLPLGIWFSGPVVGTVGSFDLKNKVTKFVRSESIFNQGTSYGLRVCTKHIATPLGTAVVSEVGDYDHFHTEFAEVCDEFNRAAVEINNMSAILADQHNNLKEFLAEFVNKRVNVPYIRTINGVNYWFVNGRNTETTTMTPEVPDNE